MSPTLVFCLLLLAAVNVVSLWLAYGVRKAGGVRKPEQAPEVRTLW